MNGPELSPRGCAIYTHAPSRTRASWLFARHLDPWITIRLYFATILEVFGRDQQLSSGVSREPSWLTGMSDVEREEVRIWLLGPPLAFQGNFRLIVGLRRMQAGVVF